MRAGIASRAGVVLIGLIVLFGWGGVALAQPPVGGQLPDFTLSAPKDGGEKGYLGLSWLSRSFRIPELKAKAVIVEIFSMYCPYCQAEAPKMNQLYQRIEGNQALKGKVKVIGIGVGNSPYEVDVFRKKYGVAFPLFPDGDFQIHKILGEARTPYFIVVKIDGGSHSVVYSKLGAFETVDGFLESVVRLSGLR
jgi:thiol-disulfide isomerase/thioredoxin